MDFAADPTTVEFQREVAAVIAQELTPEVRARVHETGTHHDWDLYRAIAAKGWLAAALPVELGGQGRGPAQLSALFRELELAGAPYDGVSNTMMVSFILGHVGTPRQKADVLSVLLSGEAIPCLGYSEPASGSDVAAAATRAVADGESWVISGQKMFTSLAEEARWSLVLTRTDSTVAKHRGLTFFLVPLDDPRVSISPVRTMTGKRTNIVFYDDVVVGPESRVGDINGGWQVMLVALAFERGVAGGVSDITALCNDMADYVRSAVDDDGRPLIESPKVRTRLARAAIDKEIADLLGSRAAWAAASGVPAQEGAEAKLFGTEAYGRAANDLLDALGPAGLLTGTDPDVPGGGALELAYRYGPVLTVAGGTSEIQKNLIAERTLGLPRRK